jgi:hypothetical protein
MESEKRIVLQGPTFGCLTLLFSKTSAISSLMNKNSSDDEALIENA